MATGMLLVIQTARRRYVVRQDDLMAIVAIARAEELAQAHRFDRPCVGVELGPLLDPKDQSNQLRRHALMVPLRRRYVALLVDKVETFLENRHPVPLPALLRARLREPWATGALVTDEDPIVELDLRAIARSVLSSQSHQN